MNEMVPSSIYRIKDQDSETTYYIGQSINPPKRFIQHKSSPWFKKLRKNGISLVLDIIEANITPKKMANIREAYWIDQYARAGHPLENYDIYRDVMDEIAREQTIRQNFLDKYKHLSDEKANLLADMKEEGQERIGDYAWPEYFEATWATIQLLSGQNLLKKDLDEIDAAKLTFKMFRIDWEEEHEVEE